MATAGASFPNGVSSVRTSDEITTQTPLLVYTCSRLGRVANPPSFSFADWFRRR
jgi:hypothetical protein